MGDPRSSLQYLRVGPGIHPSGPPPLLVGPDDRGHPPRSCRQATSACPSALFLIAQARHRLHDRAQHSAHDHRRNTARTGRYFLTVVFCRHLSEQARLAGLLTRWRVFARHHCRVGFVARCRHCDDADGRSLWRRHPALSPSCSISASCWSHSQRPIVARLWTTAGSIPATTISWFPPIRWLSFAETLLLIAFGTFAARSPSHFPPRHCCCRSASASPCRTPACWRSNCRPGCSSPSYAVVGWSTGLGFNRAILASRPLNRCRGSLLSILALMAVCAALARHARCGRRHRPAEPPISRPVLEALIQRRSSRWRATSTWHSLWPCRPPG